MEKVLPSILLQNIQTDEYQYTIANVMFKT